MIAIDQEAGDGEASEDGGDESGEENFNADDANYYQESIEG